MYWATAHLSTACGESKMLPMAQVGVQMERGGHLFFCSNFLTLAMAVVVYSAVDAAAAMCKCLQGWKTFKNLITVDPSNERVSYRQSGACIIFSVSSLVPLQFVNIRKLPQVFIEVHRAQQAKQAQQVYHTTQFDTTPSISPETPGLQPESPNHKLLTTHPEP